MNELAVKMIAKLISESQKGGIESALLDPKTVNLMDDIIDGAKRAEQFLDVPLKDRPREPFEESIPYHLDKPLRALLGFIDDGLPEYSKYKFWEERKSMPLGAKIENVITLAAQSGKPNHTIDMVQAGKSVQHINDGEGLGNRTPLDVNFSDLSPEIKDRALSRDPQAVLKNELSESHWNAVDKNVLRDIVGLAKTIQDGIPYGFRTETVPEIFAEVGKLSYEMIARRMLMSPTMGQPLPLDPAKIAEVVMAANAVGDGMGKIASMFPGVFSIFSGIASIPPTMQTRFNHMVAEFQGPLSLDTLFKALKSGQVSYIMVQEIDKALFEEASKMNGLHQDQIALLTTNIKTATEKPFLSVLTSKSESLDRKEFKDKQSEVRKNLAIEVQKAMQPKPENQQIQQPEPIDEIQEVYEDGVSMTIIPEHLGYIDPDPDDPEATQEALTPESRGWKKEAGKEGMIYSKADNIVTKEASGKFRGYSGNNVIGEYDTAEEAAQKVDSA